MWAMMDELNEPVIMSVESFSCGCRITTYVKREMKTETCLACTFRVIGHGFARLADIHREAHDARFDDPPPLEETILDKGGEKSE